MRATRRILVTLLLVTLVVAVTLWRMTWMAPGWWAPPDPTDERAAALADGFEYGLIEQAHKLRPSGEPWRIEVTEHQVNAWLSGRLEAWIAHAHELHWPPQLGAGQVRFETGGISLGLELREASRSRFIVARIIPTIVNGELALSVDRVSLGRLWIPGGPVQSLLDRLDAAAPAGFLDDPKVQATIHLVSGELRIDPSLTLTDGRRVRLLDVECNKGTVTLRCETIARRQSRRSGPLP